MRINFTECHWSQSILQRSEDDEIVELAVSYSPSGEPLFDFEAAVGIPYPRRTFVYVSYDDRQPEPEELRSILAGAMGKGVPDLGWFDQVSIVTGYRGGRPLTVRALRSGREPVMRLSDVERMCSKSEHADFREFCKPAGATIQVDLS